VEDKSDGDLRNDGPVLSTTARATLRADVEAALVADLSAPDVEILDSLLFDPHWRERLRAALQGLAPQRRVGVSLASAEHAAAVAVPLPSAARISLDEAIALASDAGAAVLSALPYGVACVDDVPNGWCSDLPGLGQEGYTRLLSWLDADAGLRAGAVVVERIAAASAPPAACAAWFFVFGAGPSPDDHAAVRARAARAFSVADGWLAALRDLCADGPACTMLVAVLARSAAWDALGDPLRALLDERTAGAASRLASEVRLQEREHGAARALERADLAVGGVDIRAVLAAEVRGAVRGGGA